MRIDDILASTGRRVVRASAFVDTDDGRLGRAPFGPAIDATFTAVFVVPFGTSLPELHPQPPPPPSEATVALWPSGRISTRRRRRTAAAAGAAHLAFDYGFVPGRVFSAVFFSGRPTAARSAPSTAYDRRPGPPWALTPVPTVPIPSDRDRAEPFSTPLLGLLTPSGSLFPSATDLDALGAAAK